MENIERMTISSKNKEILSKYQNYLITVKFLANETTVSSYVMDIYKYLEFINKDYNKSDNKDVYEYLKYLEDNKYSIYSVVRKISSIKSFYNFLAQEVGYVKNIQVERPKFYRKLPHVLTIDEVDKLLDFRLVDQYDYRNKAML